MSEVISVGGLDAYVDEIAPYSSRGITTEELSYGIGRIKPDILTLSKNILGSDMEGSCTINSGTSVATPITTALIAYSLILQNNLNSSILNKNPSLFRLILNNSVNALNEYSMVE